MAKQLAARTGPVDPAIPAAFRAAADAMRRTAADARSAFAPVATGLAPAFQAWQKAVAAGTPVLTAAAAGTTRALGALGGALRTGVGEAAGATAAGVTAAATAFRALTAASPADAAAGATRAAGDAVAALGTAVAATGSAGDAFGRAVAGVGTALGQNIPGWQTAETAIRDLSGFLSGSAPAALVVFQSALTATVRSIGRPFAAALDTLKLAPEAVITSLGNSLRTGLGPAVRTTAGPALARVGDALGAVGTAAGATWAALARGGRALTAVGTAVAGFRSAGPPAAEPLQAPAPGPEFSAILTHAPEAGGEPDPARLDRGTAAVGELSAAVGQILVPALDAAAGNVRALGAAVNDLSWQGQTAIHGVAAGTAALVGSMAAAGAAVQAFGTAAEGLRAIEAGGIAPLVSQLGGELTGGAAAAGGAVAGLGLAFGDLATTVRPLGEILGELTEVGGAVVDRVGEWVGVLGGLAGAGLELTELADVGRKGERGAGTAPAVRSVFTDGTDALLREALQAAYAPGEPAKATAAPTQQFGVQRQFGELMNTMKTELKNWITVEGPTRLAAELAKWAQTQIETAGRSPGEAAPRDAATQMPAPDRGIFGDLAAGIGRALNPAGAIIGRISNDQVDSSRHIHG